MGKSKFVEAHKPYEIKCCAIQVKLDEKYLKEFDNVVYDDPSQVKISAEASEHLNAPTKLGEQMGYVGFTMQIPYMFVLFKFEEQDKALAYFKAICEKGYGAKPVRNTVWADGRYLEGDFKQKCVTLPPDYLDKAIQDLFKKYCGGEVIITDDLRLDCLEYTGDLGGRTIHAFVGGGDKMLVMGLDNDTALQTNNPCGNYLRMIADFEKRIIAWRNDHLGCAKPLFTEVEA